MSGDWSTYNTKHLSKNREPFDVYTVWCSWRFPNGEGNRWNKWITSNVADVTCHACLDEVVRRGEAAAARAMELERDAGEEPTGGTCAHRSSFQCTWCEAIYCAPLENESTCGMKLGAVANLGTLRRVCKECEQFEHEIYSTPATSNRGVLTLVIHGPTSVAIVVDNSNGYSETAHRKALLRLRAALGRLGPSFSQPVVKVSDNVDGWKNLLTGIGRLSGPCIDCGEPDHAFCVPG